MRNSTSKGLLSAVPIHNFVLQAAGKEVATV